MTDPEKDRLLQAVLDEVKAAGQPPPPPCAYTRWWQRLTAGPHHFHWTGENRTVRTKACAKTLVDIGRCCRCSAECEWP